MSEALRGSWTEVTADPATWPEAGKRVLCSDGYYVCEGYREKGGTWRRAGSLMDMAVLIPGGVKYWAPLLTGPRVKR